MLSRILFILVSFALLSACKNDCEENAPQPLSLKIQWVNGAGEDMYAAKELNRDSLFAFYKKVRGIDSVSLSPAIQRKDSTKYYVDAMPLIRAAFSLQIDTVFIAPKRNKDVDTIVAKLERIENDCFSTVYRFEQLEYNGKKMIQEDGFYKIEK